MRSFVALAGVLVLALAVSSAKAQNVTSIASELRSRNMTLAVALLEAANMTSVLSAPAARYTLFVPSDAAITDFLSRMGLSAADLVARPVLARRLIAQHIVLNSNLRQQDIFTNGSSARIIPTLASVASGSLGNLLYRRLANDSFKVTDVHGNVANAKRAVAIDGEKSVHPVDKVLMPEDVFYSLPDLCRFRRMTIRTFCNAIAYADLNATLSAPTFNGTIFLPNDAAFAKAIQLAGGDVPSPAATASLLKYHVVAGPRELPDDFPAGRPVPTLLANQSIAVTYERVTPTAGQRRMRPYARALVATTSGQSVPVLRSNVFVGRAIVQGISTVLQPGNRTLPSAPAAVGRRLLGWLSPSAQPGRRLLDYGWGFDGGPTAEMDAASEAIQNAADGYETPADAAGQSLLGAEELSVPGDYAQVDEGINPW